MQEIITVMRQLFHELQSGGAYFILLAVALCALYRTNEKRNRGYILYSVLVVVLICMNPFLIWMLSKAFPILGTYRHFSLLLPTLIIVPAALCELLEKVRDMKRNLLLIFLSVLIIGISGTVFGIYSGNVLTRDVLTDEETEVIHVLEEEEPQMVLADEEILPFLRTVGDWDFHLLYGRDLYQANTDYGIMDVYDEEMLSLY